ncbi:AbrB/MazE/SpoVT family DNA-binding domain-containing protein [bacterium]|nr:AbrB/MazE/SpoVT family DNA-binding domain-containing protein [bacterium]
MATAKVFVNGRSQAVRIPKEYRFDTDEVFINKIGSALILIPKEDLAAEFEKGASMLTDDFLAEGLPEALPSHRDEL